MECVPFPLFPFLTFPFTSLLILSSTLAGQLQEFPFDSDVKRMSVVYRRHADEKQFIYSKGAIERVLDACSHIQLADGPATLDEPMKETVLANVEALAEQGLRVLGLASKAWAGAVGDADRKEVEKDLTLYGLVGLYDPPRPETQGAVRACHRSCPLFFPSTIRC